MHDYKDSEKWVKSFCRIFDRNVKLYQSTEKCPNRALHNLVTLGGQAKAHFCRCTFLLISISTDLCNKKVPHFTLHFFVHFLRRAFFSKRMGSAHFCSGGGVGVPTSCLSRKLFFFIFFNSIYWEKVLLSHVLTVREGI